MSHSLSFKVSFAWNPGLGPNVRSNIEGILRIIWLGGTPSLFPTGYNHCSWTKNIPQLSFIVFFFSGDTGKHLILGFKGLFLVFGTFAERVRTVHQTLLFKHCLALRISRPSDKDLQVAPSSGTSHISATTYMVMIMS